MNGEKKELLEHLGRELAEAWCSKKTVPPFTRDHGELTLEDAYEIQKVMMAELCARGFTPSGRKMGYTNPAMQKKMGLAGPSWGWLLAERRFTDGEKVLFSDFIQPGIETELLFVLKEDLNNGPYDRKSLLQAVAGFRAAMEIVDMRQIRQGKTQRDSVGDEGAFGACVAGTKLIPAAGLNLSEWTSVLYRNGVVEAEGTGKAVMEDPVNALLWLANELWNTEEYLRTGEEILTGSFTPLAAAGAGDVFRAVFNGKESVEICFA